MKDQLLGIYIRINTYLPTLLLNMTSISTPEPIWGANPLSILLRISAQQQMLCVLLGLVTYLVLVSSLRFKRRQSLHRKYSHYARRDSMNTMTDQDAWAIQKTIMQTEFPFIVLKSLQFALFRVCTMFQLYTLKADQSRHMAFQLSQVSY
jgi:hypothetical protein